VDYLQAARPTARPNVADEPQTVRTYGDGGGINPFGGKVVRKGSTGAGDIRAVGYAQFLSGGGKLMSPRPSEPMVMEGELTLSVERLSERVALVQATSAQWATPSF